VIEDESENQFACNIDGCTRRFKLFTQLGGHKSKSHPNRSTVYQAKMIKRKARENERALLKMAKEVFIEQNPGLAPQNCRYKIRVIKAKLLQ